MTDTVTIRRELLERHLNSNCPDRFDPSEFVKTSEELRAALAAPVQGEAVPASIEQIRLWFFRDLSDSQRLALFSICGWPVDELVTHSAQSLVLRKLLTPPQPADVGELVEALRPLGERIAKVWIGHAHHDDLIGIQRELDAALAKLEGK